MLDMSREARARNFCCDPFVIGHRHEVLECHLIIWNPWKSAKISVQRHLKKPCAEKFPRPPDFQGVINNKIVCKKRALKSKAFCFGTGISFNVKWLSEMFVVMAILEDDFVRNLTDSHPYYKKNQLCYFFFFLQQITEYR